MSQANFNVPLRHLRQVRRGGLILWIALLAFTLAGSARAHAQQPITVQTIVSRSGGHWNAPASPATFFSSYSPPPGQVQPQRTGLGPELHHQPLSTVFPGSVIGNDDRTLVKNTREFPYSAIVFLRVFFPGGGYTECSGWVVSSRMVATAGHCIEDAVLGWADSAVVYAGLNGQTALGTARSREFYTITGWQESHQPEFDYGAIQLDSPLGDRVGWIGMTVMDDNTLRSVTARVTGYPADKPAQTMWTMAGPIVRSEPLRLFYAIDTYPGESGSPVYNALPTRACRYCVIAIHGYGTGADPAGRYNSGVRITRAVLDNFLFWRQLP